MSELSLSDLSIGQEASITSISGEGSSYRSRLLSMGFIPGAIVSIVRVAPLGDPIEVSIKGYRLGLRRDEAVIIKVSTSAAAGEAPRENKQESVK